MNRRFGNLIARTVFTGIFLFPVCVFASDIAGTKLIENNPDLFAWLFGGCVLMLGWFFNRTVRKIDTSIAKVWETVDRISIRLATLEGTCSARQENEKRRP